MASCNSKLMYALSTIIWMAFHVKEVAGWGGNGGWTGAHATFYGGGDASGTMGTCLQFLEYL